VAGATPGGTVSTRCQLRQRCVEQLPGVSPGQGCPPRDSARAHLDCRAVDPTVRVVAWRRADEDRGHSLARLERRPDGWLCSGTEVLAGPGALLACGFRIEVDAGWATRRVEAWSVSAAGEVRVRLAADADRHWWLDGARSPHLDGCLDVDVAATPLTNTFPINRLAGLAVGAAVTFPVAWVDVPGLGVTRVDQTYRRLADRRWQYSDERYGAFELSVDDDGLVVDYTGFAIRVAP